jgi:hypothetical protein
MAGRRQGPVDRQPVAPSEALHVLAEDPLDAFERGVVCPARLECQHAVRAGVQPAAAADDRREVHEALAVVEADVELVSDVLTRLMGEVLAELPQIGRGAIGGDAGAADDHATHVNPVVVAPDCERTIGCSPGSRSPAAEARLNLRGRHVDLGG